MAKPQQSPEVKVVDERAEEDARVSELVSRLEALADIEHAEAVLAPQSEAGERSE